MYIMGITNYISNALHCTLYVRLPEDEAGVSKHVGVIFNLCTVYNLIVCGRACERPSFTPTFNNRQNHSSLCFTLGVYIYFFLESAQQNDRFWMVR